MSQHATPCAASAGLGSYFHFTAPFFVRSSAYNTFGKGATRYIVSPTTSGAPSCPRSTPVENVHATCIFLTFSMLIWSSPEYRVLAKSLVAIVHWSSSAGIFAVGLTDGAVACAPTDPADTA